MMLVMLVIEFFVVLVELVELVGIVIESVMLVIGFFVVLVELVVTVFELLMVWLVWVMVLQALLQVLFWYLQPVMGCLIVLPLFSCLLVW